ncbi:DnaB-like helicase C-terminal domain-containing protein [Thorsellia anophelis]|uniref:DNA 5'-3' helicase n=1 Tax=Thorsellia anophelis DSM 18579 TaxID=1123402 RepID=A0A1I0D989_9GAMM|nr:DnaB-like helicase C-terminal domain-containing protein [Thorsellia anophelis]SET28851.1 replicative DNA helicase [Thorsellia anophelis DSM 18579]
MTNNTLTLPPQSIEAEQSVIGGLLILGDDERCQRVLNNLKAESFYTHSHKMIYTTVKNLVKKQVPIDVLTVSEDLANVGLIEQVGGFAYLAEMAKNTPSIANIETYARIVREKAIERYTLNQLHKMTQMFYEDKTMPTNEKLDAVSAMFNQLNDFTKKGTKTGLKSLDDIFEDWTNKLEQRLDPNSDARGLLTGIESLDELLAPKGVVKGSLFVVGARPKMGKSALMTTMSVHCAVNQNRPVAIFSLEMPTDQVFERMITQQTGLNSDIFYMGPDSDSDYTLAFAAAHKMAQTGNLFIDDTPGVSLAHIVSECRRVKKLKGSIGMVFVDYLTLMKAEKADRNDLAYGIITKGLKNLAKELDCVVVLLTQLNRDLEKRTNKRPLPSDSRDTGQIEQDCDYWLGIYREGAYDENANQNITELILRLNRHGKSGTVFVEQRQGSMKNTDQAQAKMAFMRDEPVKQKRYASGF